MSDFAVCIIIATCITIVTFSCSSLYKKIIKEDKNINESNLPIIKLVLLKFCRSCYLYHSFFNDVNDRIKIKLQKLIENSSLHNNMLIDNKVNKELINQVTDLENQIKQNL